MPRRKIASKHTINPDPRYNSVLVTKFTHGIMEKGKKSLAQRIFYGAMDIIEQQVSDQEPIAVFDKAMEKVRPKVEVNALMSLFITAVKNETENLMKNNVRMKAIGNLSNLPENVQE